MVEEDFSLIISGYFPITQEKICLGIRLTAAKSWTQVMKIYHGQQKIDIAAGNLVPPAGTSRWS
jgi:hypothetical protein